jgi:metallo-beta-lactamase family protein
VLFRSLSAHAGQDGLAAWYGAIAGRPPLVLVHGEARGRDGLAARVQGEYGIQALRPALGDRIPL